MSAQSPKQRLHAAHEEAQKALEDPEAAKKIRRAAGTGAIKNLCEQEAERLKGGGKK